MNQIMETIFVENANGSINAGSFFLCLGVSILLGILFSICMELLSLLLVILKFGEKQNPELLLRITIPESLDYTRVFDEIFDTYAKKCKLLQVKTTNMGI